MVSGPIFDQITDGGQRGDDAIVGGNASGSASSGTLKSTRTSTRRCPDMEIFDETVFHVHGFSPVKTDMHVCGLATGSSAPALFILEARLQCQPARHTGESHRNSGTNMLRLLWAPAIGNRFVAPI